MKINKIYLGAAALLLLASCDDDWNEDKLDGFQEGVEMTDVKAVEYTLTDADYKKIASNKANKALADSEGLSDQLNNLSKNKYFTEEITAAKFLPAYLAETYPTADNKSAVKVTYTKFIGEPAYLAAFENGTTYEVKPAEYTAVWEAKKVDAQYLTPKTISKLPAILKAANPQAKQGDVVIANYNFSQTEPSISLGGDDKVQVPGAWQQLTIPTYPAGNNWNWFKSGDIDLSAFAGKKIQIGFTYVSDGTDKGTATYSVAGIKVAAGGATVFEEGFSAGLGDCSVEEVLPEGLKFVWKGASRDGKNYAQASAFVPSSKQRYAITSTLVTPVIDLKKAGSLSFEHQLNFFKLGADKIPAFIKVSVREMIEMDKDQAKGPFYAKTTSVVEGAKYLIAANVDGVWKTATPLEKGGNPYGYFKFSDQEGEVISANADVNALAFVFKKTAKGYSMQDAATGRFFGMDNSHNSFQVSDTYAEASDKKSFDWKIEAQANGSVKIINVAFNKSVQFDGKYKSFGAYPDERGVLPCLMIYNDAPAVTRATPQVSYNASSVYAFDGSAWKEAHEEGVDVQAIDPSVYNTVGKDYIPSPSAILPEYMAIHNPYALEGDKVAVVYLAKDQKVEAKELVLTEGKWVITTHVAQVVDQFVKANGVWNFDPSVIVDLLTKGDLTDLYYQSATDWVWDNIDVPAGCTKKGEGFVSSYGNNEYYTGCSAHYDNVDWRANKAISQNPKAYEGMSEDEVVAKMKEHFIEVMKPVLEKIHPEAKPVDGVEVLYTLNFIVYTGSNQNWTIAYKVTAPGTFEYVPESLKVIE